jgi:hypothetical protein
VSGRPSGGFNRSASFAIYLLSVRRPVSKSPPNISGPLDYCEFIGLNELYFNVYSSKLTTS